MKRVTAIILLILLFAMVSPAYADENPHGLTPREYHFFAQRGHTQRDVDSYPKELVRELLEPYRKIIVPFDVPSGYVKVTGIPGNPANNEWFHKDTGLINGPFTSQPGYTQMRNAPGTFALVTLGQDLPPEKTMYYLWGEWDDEAGTHQGVDVQGARYSTVKSAHDGILVFKGGEHGSVGIYDGTYTHYYLHMTDLTNKRLNSNIYYGEVIGKQGAVGIEPAFYHLHYECHAGRDSGGPAKQTGLNTVNPYYRMVSGGYRANDNLE